MAKRLYENVNDVLNALLSGELKRYRAMANYHANKQRESFELAEMYRKSVALYDQIVAIKKVN